MKNKRNKFFGEKGMGIIEIVIVVALLLLVFVGLTQVIFMERRAQNLAREDTAGYMLARETMEAVRSVRDSDWTNISTLSYATDYYPQINASSQWELVAANPGPVGVYTRRIQLSQVFRDANDNIAVSGTGDADTRKITVYVQWTRPGGDLRTVTLESYLTNWQNYK